MVPFASHCSWECSRLNKRLLGGRLVPLQDAFKTKIIWHLTRSHRRSTPRPASREIAHVRTQTVRPALDRESRRSYGCSVATAAYSRSGGTSSTAKVSDRAGKVMSVRLLIRLEDRPTGT